MDKLSIFTKDKTEVTLETNENNNLDTVVNELSDIRRELKLARKGQEAFIYGEEIEESDEVELDDIEDMEAAK